MAIAAASDLERRKKVRIRMRRDLAIAPQKYEGRTYYVVKDPVSMRYYRFKEQEHFLIKMMDGGQTLDDAQKEYEKRFRPERLTLEDLEGFAQQLLSAGLAQNESPQAAKQLLDRRGKRRRMELLQTFTNILYIKIPVFDPDKLLTKMLPFSWWIFTTTFLVASVAFMASAIMLVMLHFQVFRDKLPSYQEFFSFGTVAYLWVALGLVKIIHEFGHGLSCKAFGGEVHEMGALFLVFSPCLYCNVSDAWTLPSKWKRIIISFAGIYVELVIAAASTWIWWNTPSWPFLNNLCLSLMIVCSVSTVVFNANPLMRYDGYYILADWLEIPNLRDRANRYLSRLFMEHCLGIEVHPEPYMDLWRRVLFVFYAIVSYVYRWVITFSILYFMSMFLKPYKLEVVSKMLAVMAAGSMIGWPLYRMIKNYYKRGRMPDMKSVRVTLTSLAAAAILLFVFLVPLPVSRLRQLGLVQIVPDKQSKVVIHVQGILKDLRVHDGQHVEKDAVLAVFENVDLRNQLDEARMQRADYDYQYANSSRATFDQALDPSSRSRLETLMAEASSKRGYYAEQVKVLEKQLAELELRAPREGTVMNPPQIDEVGKSFDRNSLFCTIGEPSALRVLMPVTTSEFNLLQRDLSQDADKQLPVTLRVQGRANLTWKGVISQLPQSEADDIPIQLTNKAGGNVAVKPPSSAKQNQNVPQAQQFLVGIDIVDPDLAIHPGTLAYVKVHCRYRTTAWWIWHSFNSAFDLGMELPDLLPKFMRPAGSS